MASTQVPVVKAQPDPTFDAMKKRKQPAHARDMAVRPAVAGSVVTAPGSK